MPALALRDYQSDAVAAIQQAYLANDWAQLLVLPTGGGKTVIFGALPAAMRAWLEVKRPGLGRRMLVLAHREELLDQAAATLQRMAPTLLVEVEQAGRRASAAADVIVASVQTLAAQKLRRLRALNPLDIGILVVDEAHHAAAESYQAILRFFGLIAPPDLLPFAQTPALIRESRDRVRAWRQMVGKEFQPPLLLGVTATPDRADAVGLEWTFGTVVFSRTIRDLIEAGWLCDLKGYLITTGTSLDGVRTQGGDFKLSDLDDAINTPERNLQVVKGYRDYGETRKTLAFTATVNHAQELARAFQQQGYPAEAIWGDCPDRAGVLARFRTGETNLVTNCNVLTEGFDQPDVACIIHARPTRSRPLYVQMTGRGTRLAEGKQDCLVLDFVDVSRKHALVTVTDLFGMPSGLNLRGGSVLSGVKKIEQLQELAPQLSMPLGTTLDDLEQQVMQIDLWKVQESQIVRQYAAMRWQEQNPNVFTLALPARSASGALSRDKLLEIRRGTLGDWVVRLRNADGTVKDGKGYEDLGAAFASAERWVRKDRPDLINTVSASSNWRRGAPTVKQVAALRRIRAPESVIANLTAGQASDLLDKFYTRKRRDTP